VRKNRINKTTTNFDKRFLLLVIFLTVSGLILIADASAPLATRDFSDKFYFLKEQTVSALIGLVLLFITMRIKYTFWQKFAMPIFFATILLLILVLIPGIGGRFLGARRWLTIGPIPVQPSEILKLAIAIYIAKVSVTKDKILAYLFPIALSAGLVMLQPDLGTTIVISIIGVSQLFVSGINILLLSCIVGGGGVLALILTITSSYRKDRLLTFLEQTSDPLGRSYHIRQILLALGTGGVLGVGLGQSRQKYLFLPETATDSIFAVIAEEIGFIGAAFLISIFVYLILRGIKIVKNAPDTFSRILGVGIVTWLASQALLNLASVVALVPLTGVPLPFLSYGGSSLVMLLCGCGILLNISRYGKTN
jgi:cell division protein FtsW